MRLSHCSLLMVLSIALGLFVFAGKGTADDLSDPNAPSEDQSVPGEEKSAQSERQSMKVLRVDVRGNQVISTTAVLNNINTKPHI